MNGRSAAESVFIRPVNSLTSTRTYFLPGFLGGDHSLKFGGYWRDSNTTSINHTGGFGTVRFPTSATTIARFRRRAARSIWSATATRSTTCSTTRPTCRTRSRRAGRPPARPALRLQPRQGAAVEHRRQSARRPVAAGDRLPRRRPWRGVQRFFAASRHHLQRDRRRPHAGPRQLRALLRAGWQRRRCRHGQPGRLDHAAISVD